MPNWCSQYLTVQGDHKEIDRFVKEAQRIDANNKKSFELNCFVPCPQELVDTMEGSYGDEEKQKELIEKQNRNIQNYGFATWYDWANTVWGTKWGACDVQLNLRRTIKDKTKITDKHGVLEIQFQSAWSPASGLITGISMLFPTLLFAVWFIEESLAYAGWQLFKNGEVLAEHEIDPQPPSSEEITDENDWRDAYEVWQDEFTGLLAISVRRAIDSALML